MKNSQLLKQLIETHLSFIIEFEFDLNLIEEQKQNKRKFVANSE